MARPHYTQFYFNRRHDMSGFEHVSTCGGMVLDALCGETIAAALCDHDNALEMVRFQRNRETVIIQRRLTDIVARIIRFV